MIDDASVWAHLDALAKPKRSMGRLEELAVRLAVTQGRIDPRTKPRRIVLFAGDHGCVADGVSAWPSAVTGMMVATILDGRATSNALAAAHDCALRLVDVGVVGARPVDPPGFYRDARVADGTASLVGDRAMEPVQFKAAWRVGTEEADRAMDQGVAVLIAGEMGIGNTTPAAALTVLLAGTTASAAVGRGAGADDAVVAIKTGIVAAAAARALTELADDPIAAIASVAGFEIAAMAGFFARGAERGATLLLDGYVATAAALSRSGWCPAPLER
jgi:nicotinate-nucleotide--dimethylbenzimidazole phosphoribosyltransferase